MDMLFLQANLDPLTAWGQFGLAGLIIGFMLFFILRPLVNSHIAMNKAIGESISELPTVLLEQKNAYETGFKLMEQRLERINDDIKEIKSKIK